MSTRRPKVLASQEVDHTSTSKLMTPTLRCLLLVLPWTQTWRRERDEKKKTWRIAFKNWGKNASKLRVCQLNSWRIGRRYKRKRSETIWLRTAQGGWWQSNESSATSRGPMSQRHQANSMMSLYLRHRVKEISCINTNNVCDQVNQSMRCKHPSIRWVIHFLGVPFSITLRASQIIECNPWKGAISLILTVKYNEMVKERRFHKCKQHSRWWHSLRTLSASLTTTASTDIVCQIIGSMQS